MTPSLPAQGSRRPAAVSSPARVQVSSPVEPLPEQLAALSPAPRAPASEPQAAALPVSASVQQPAEVSASE